jgi:hypothetical protein
MATVPQKEQWVPRAQLADLWAAPANPTLEKNLEVMGGELTDPWYRVPLLTCNAKDFEIGEDLADVRRPA